VPAEDAAERGDSGSAADGLAREDIGPRLRAVNGDRDVRFGDEDEPLAVGLRDAGRGDLVEAGKEPNAQEEAGDVARAPRDPRAVGNEVKPLDWVVPQALPSLRPHAAGHGQPLTR
jgi:hypothetical protein